MKPFDYVRSLFSAATVLPSPPTPVVKGKQLTIPSFLLNRTPPTTTPLLRIDKQLTNTDLTTLRTGSDSREVIAKFTRASPDLSAAVASYIRTGITTGFRAIAYNMDGTVNPEATSALAQVITRLNVLNDYEIGYDDSMSMRSVSEVWARELVTHGQCCGELVLDKARLPDKIQPVSTRQIRLFPTPDGRKRIPQQYVQGIYTPLDVPTFFMVNVDEDIMDAYPVSPIEPAIQAVIFSADFMNDIRRVVKKAIHPRQVASIDEEKFRANLPQEVKQDQALLEGYLSQVVATLSEQVNGLEPEDALVLFDTVGFTVVDHGNTNLSQEYKVVQEMADAKLIAGSKTLPSVLGKGNGTSNTASTEAMMFVKNVEGMVWAKLNEMWSKILTLAIRLLGHDCTVDFRYNTIDLRPESELESFKAMKQSRYFALLSLGMITDEEACIELTGHLPPAGYTPMMGTGFMPATSVQPAGDGNNGASNSGSTLNQSLNKDKPGQPKSQNGGKKVAEVVPIHGQA